MIFSEENVTELSNIMDALGDILIQTGFGNYVDHLSQIRLAAKRHDDENFYNYVVNRGSFGGSGAIWEIWIENKDQRKEFEKRLCYFIDHLKKMGINNARIDQVRDSFH